VTRRGGSALQVSLRWLSVLGWAGIIWWMLTLPGEETPDIGFIPLGDKLGHAAAYCLWGFLICWAADKSFRALSRTGIAVVSVLAATVYGILSELYQAGIGRDAELLDVLADVAGAVAAPYLYFSPKLRAMLNRIIAGRAVSAGQIGHRVATSLEDEGSERNAEADGEVDGRALGAGGSERASPS
jgi:VanZ family protein